MIQITNLCKLTVKVEIEREMHQIMDTNYHIAPGVHPVGGHTKVLHGGL